jgi:hypothetical protein
MLASMILYSGLVLMLGGAGVAIAALLAPARESHASGSATRLDAITPVWQFREVHTLRIDAPPARVYEAIKRVRADEIFLFRTLTWIRRGGRAVPQNILNAGTREPLIDVATRSTFALLADQPPQEIVIGAVVLAPAGTTLADRRRVFDGPAPPGFAVATMNFLVTPDGPNASRVSTETRIFANGASARRRFGAYWRVIYPGSAFIRRMWLRAIERRALTADTAPSGVG